MLLYAQLNWEANQQTVELANIFLDRASAAGHTCWDNEAREFVEMFVMARQPDEEPDVVGQGSIE